MTILHNGLFLGRPHTGIGQYHRHLLEALRELGGDRHVVLTPGGVKLPKGVKEYVVPVPRVPGGLGVALDRWETTAPRKALQDIAANLYFSPYPTAPVKLDIPVATTVHDAIPWTWPEYRSGLRSRVRLHRQLAGLKKADHLLTVSETSRAEVAALTGRPPREITVTYDGIDPFYLAPLTESKIAATKRRFGLRRPYLFYVGGFDVRKNVRALLAAFSEAELAGQYDLVLAGDLTAPATPLYQDFHDLPELIARHGLTEVVKRTGFVSEADKKTLLAGAALFVYPSLAEGFGLPILEALAVGTPTLASDINVNRELFAKAAVLIRTDSPGEFAASLRNLPRLANRGKQTAGRRLAQKMTWQSVAEKTQTAFAELTLVAPGKRRHI